MGDLYQSKSFPTNVLDTEIKSVTSGILIGPILNSPLVNRFSNIASSNVVSTGVGFDSLVIRHMGPHTQIAAFGVVTAHTGNGKLDKSKISDKYPVICQLIQSFFQ